MSVPKTIEDVIQILEESQHQGRALDDPEGSCYKSFSCTLCKLMVDALRNERAPGSWKARRELWVSRHRWLSGFTKLGLVRQHDYAANPNE